MTRADAELDDLILREVQTQLQVLDAKLERLESRADADRWITVKAPGAESGSPVLLGEDGRVKGGAGGNLNGKVLDPKSGGEARKPSSASKGEKEHHEEAPPVSSTRPKVAEKDQALLDELEKKFKRKDRAYIRYFIKSFASPEYQDRGAFGMVPYARHLLSSLGDAKAKTSSPLTKEQWDAQVSAKERLSPTGKKSEKGRYVRNPLPVAPVNELVGEGCEIEATAAKEDPKRLYTTSEKVDPKDVVSYQETVNPEKVDEYLNDPYQTPGLTHNPWSTRGSEQRDKPLVIKTNGRHIVLDGNHRMAAALLLGRGALDCDVFDVDRLTKDLKTYNQRSNAPIGSTAQFIRELNKAKT